MSEQTYANTGPCVRVDNDLLVWRFYGLGKWTVASSKFVDDETNVDGMAVPAEVLSLVANVVKI